MPTQAKKEGNARHIAKLDTIKVQPYKAEGQAIRAAAAAAGASLQGYILDAVRAKMAADAAGAVLVAIPRAKIEAGAERTGKTEADYIAALEK